jgi:hypothetical protein
MRRVQEEQFTGRFQRAYTQMTGKRWTRQVSRRGIVPSDAKDNQPKEQREAQRTIACFQESRNQISSNPLKFFSIRSNAILATLSIYGVSTTPTILPKSSRISNLQHQDILSSNFRQLIHSRSDLLSLNH